MAASQRYCPTNALFPGIVDAEFFALTFSICYGRLILRVEAGLHMRIVCHAVRHSLAAHLIEDGYDARTVQEFSFNSMLCI